MIKLIGGAVIGIMVSGLGVYIASLYFMESRHEGNSPLLLGIGAVLVAVGIFAFIKGFLVMRADKALASDENLLMPTPEGSKNDGGVIMQKNNQMLKDWNNVNEQRDKLKMLEAAGAAEEG